MIMSRSLHGIIQRLVGVTAAAALITAPAACSFGEGGEVRADEERAQEGDPVHAADHEEAEAEAGAERRVTLTEAGFETAGIVVQEVRPEEGGGLVVGTEVPGRVEFAPGRVALISPRTSGRIERLRAVEGDRVRAGEVVGEVLSHAFLTAQSDLVQASQRADLLEGTADAEGAEALLAAARRRLRLLGVSEDEVARLEAGGEPRDLLPIRAPFDGSIIEAYALAGAAVEPGEPIFRVADLSVLDVVAEVPEQTLRYLEIGRPAAVNLAAYPELRLTGRIQRILGELDPEMRTVEAIIQMPNPERRLRPGMFATVTLQVPVSSAEGARGRARPLTIPRSALVTEGDAHYVFVELGPRTFERRAVVAAPFGFSENADDRVLVQSGLVAGERVVTAGAFTLKSELGEASLGDHH